MGAESSRSAVSTAIAVRHDKTQRLAQITYKITAKHKEYDNIPILNSAELAMARTELERLTVTKNELQAHINNADLAMAAAAKTRLPTTWFSWISPDPEVEEPV